MEEKYKLSKWRRIKGFSQEDLAEEVKVSTKTISRYENEGFKSASFPTVLKIVDALDITLDQLEIK